MAVLPLPGSPPTPVIAVPSVARDSGVSAAEPASAASRLVRTRRKHAFGGRDREAVDETGGRTSGQRHLVDTAREGDRHLLLPLGQAQDVVAVDGETGARAVEGVDAERGLARAGGGGTGLLGQPVDGLCPAVQPGRLALAHHWGFVSQAHFTRVFRGRFGRTPGPIRLPATEGLSGVGAG